ncbi:MAG TPA: PilZ domain-containing protein [Terriglobales bacterium]|nr:PilZ domain-containing protein [Terriglobales bacterium]
MDKRPATRYDFRCEAQFCKRGSNAPLRGFLSDISLSGCYFETLTPEPVGTPVEVFFQASGVRVRLPGVVRVVHPSMGMGIEFAELPSEAAKGLQVLVKAQAAGAS